MKQILFTIISVSLLLTACQENKKDEYLQLVKKWQGKEIAFPEEMAFTRFVTDTVTGFELPKTDYKVLVYVDSIGCTSCKLQLHKWKELIAYTDSLTNKSVPYIFVFQSKDDKELRYLLKRDNFDLPVCIDHDSRMNKLNQFPADMTFQTFLLDRNNKVVVLGNPVHNTAVKDLYIKQITGKDNPAAKLLKTTARAIQDDIDFGIFPIAETKNAVFEIENTGDKPLVIVDVSTTCGCTVATYDKEPAKPGDKLRIQVRMTPKDTGFFDEVVTIKCNTTSPVKVKIRGNVQ